MKLKDFRKYYSPSPKESEPEEKGISDFFFNGDFIDSGAAGAGRSLETWGKILNEGMRPENMTQAEWEEHQSPFFKAIHETMENEGRDMYNRNVRQYEPETASYYLDQMFQSMPESLAIMAGSMAAGAPLGGVVGAVGRGLGTLAKALPGAADLSWKLAKAYQAGNIFSKGARAFTPQNAQALTSSVIGAHFEALSEAQNAYDEALQMGKSEEEARAIRDNVYRDMVGIVSAFNVPQYNMLLGNKPARGLLGKVGRLAGAMGAEGAEESTQEIASAYELGKPQNWQQIRDAGIVGGLMGGVIHGGVNSAQWVANKGWNQPSEKEIEQARQQRRDALNQRGTEAYNNQRRLAESYLEDSNNYREATARSATRRAMQENSSGIDNFMRAISGQESGSEEGNYNAVNGRTNATGRFQIMPENWSAWARDAGLPANAPMTSENQDRVARNKMQEYYNKFGNWRDVAIAWYGGEGAVSYSEEAKNRPQGNNDEPSINEYADSVMSRFEKIGGEESSGRQSRGGNIFGVGNYNMPTQSGSIDQQVSQLKDGWQAVIPQIGGVLRDKFGINAEISSAARTAEHNAEVGGVPTSHHIIRENGGDALDIVFDRETSQEEQDAIADYFRNTGLFSEVLYHDVGSGAHLHLGGLKTENLNSVQSRAQENFNEEYRPQSWEEYRRERQPFGSEQENPRIQEFQLYRDIANRKYQEAQQNKEDLDFFEGIFNKHGEYQDTLENRMALRRRFADDFKNIPMSGKIDFGKIRPAEQPQPQIQQPKPAQPQQQAQPQQIQQPQSENPLLVNESLRDIAIKYYESLDQTDANNHPFAEQLDKAIGKGDTSKITQLLAERGISTTPTQPDPVTQNKPPENILPTPQQQQTQSQAKLQSQTQKGKRSEEKQQKLIADASAPVNTGKTPKDNNNRIKQAKAIITLANENKVQIPKEDKADLYEGNLAVLQKWHDELSKRGLFNASQPQAQAQQVEPQRQDNSAAILKAREAYDNRKNQPPKQEEQQNAQPQPQLQSQAQQQAQPQVQDTSEQSEIDKWLNETFEDEELQPKSQEKPVPQLQAQPETQAQVQQQSQPANQTEPKKTAKSKWHTIGSADSREDLQRHIREKFFGAPLTIQEDGSVVHEETGEILSGIVRNNKGRWQYGKYEDNVEAEPKAELGKPKVQENKISGDEVDATTDSGESYKAQYKVIEAKDLIASHVIDNGNVFANKVYPKELQPRDRNRSGMKSRLIAMAQNLNPAQLLEKALNVNLGAPTSRNDGVILNGNGRTAAIQHAYKNNLGEPYKKALIERAKEFGLNSEDIAKMNQPVLVREMISGLTEQETRDVTNAQAGGEKLSASEQATADADKISESTLATFPKGESIDFTNRDNAEFVNALLRDIATPSEMNNLVSDEGLTQDGVNRITRALFAYAYGNNQKAIRRVTESTDDNVKAITNSLIAAVPYLSKIKGMIERGKLPKYKFEVFAGALEKLSALRAQGETLYDFLNQTTLFEEDAISDDLREALQTFETFKRSQKKLTQTIKSIARQIYDQRDSHKENLFGEKSEAIPLTKLIREARDEVANEGQKSLFSQQGKDVDTTIKNYIDQKDLTPQQQLLQDFGRKLGTRVIFFNNGDGRFHGQHSNGITYLNVVSNMPLGKVFWHESMHWLKANNPKLYQRLVKAAGITDEQRQAYLERTERNDLKTDEAIDEEIIADQFEDVAKRSGLLQSIAGKNRSLIQRVIQWLQDTMKRFIEHFRNPQGKFTTAQSQALADEFGEIAKDLVDPNGEQIFRYNRRTHNVELANGRDWDSIEQGKFDSVGTISFSTTGNLIATDEEYMQAVEEFQSAKTESDKQQALEALQSMVQKAAEVSGFHNAVPEQTVAYKVRTTAAPKKAIKVYKVFTVASDGSPTALFVGGTEKLPQGVWLDAQDAYHFKAKNGLYYVPSTQNPFTKGGKTGGSVEIPNESIREELIKRGFLPKGSKATKITALAYRPGWHAGTLPFFPQGGMKPPKGMKSAYENIHRYNQVVFECELAAEKNYTAEAEAQLKARNKDGSLNSRKADLQYMPENGFYYYATNPMTHGHPEMGMWAISGSLKINRALTQEECDKILADNGKLPQEWEQGKLNLADLGYTGEQNDAARKTLAPITYDDNGNIIPLSQRFDATKNDIRYSIDASDNSNESTSQRIRNKISAFFNPPSKSRNKRIKQFLEKLADIRIVAGHIKGAKLINVDEFHRLLHTRKAYDWENILPEIGGMLAKSLNIQDSDAMRNYVTDWLLTGAPNNNSAEAMIFQQAARNNPAMFEILQKIRDEFDEFNNLEPEERYAEGITDGDKTLGEKLGYYKENWREEFTDDLHPIERMFNQAVAKAEKTNPKLAEWLKESVNPYELARLVRGMGAVAKILVGNVGSSPSKKINEIRTKLAEAYPNVNFSNFKPITMILEEIGALKDKKRQRLFEAFCVAKLDKEMYEKMRSEPEKYKGITPFRSESDADATIAKYEKEFGQAQRDLVHYSNILLTMRYDAGLMSKSKYNEILSGWQNYIPTARVFEENEDYDFIDSLKQKTGSHRDIRTPIQKLIDNTNSLVKQAERNKVKCQVAQLARCGQFGQIIAVTENSKPNLDNTVLFYEHGKKCWLETPDLSVVRALNSIQSQKDGAWIVKAFNAVMSWFKGLQTFWNPDFSAGNAFRDSAAAYIHNKHLGYANPFMFFADVARIGLKGFWTKDSNWLEWQMFGGSQASFVSQDVDYVQRSISDITETSWESFKKHPLSYILDKMQYIAEASETATRLTTYVRARDALAKQRADGKATIDDKRRAALTSRNATIDFSRAGTSTRKANRVFAFANAAVQDFALQAQTFSPAQIQKAINGNKQAQQQIFSAAFRLVLMGIVPTLLQFALMHRDDDKKKQYKNLHDWEKETYWYLPIPGFEIPFRIPKSMDIGVRLTSAITDEFLKTAIDKDPAEWKRFRRLILDAAPGLTATLATPAVEAWANYSFFRDAPIVPGKEQDLPGNLQYGHDTSPAAKFISDNTLTIAKIFGAETGFSPRKIDYMISGYLGFMGRFFSGGTDEYPIVRRFIYEPYKNPKIVKDYYEALDEQASLYNGYKLELQKDRKTKPPEDFDPKLYGRLKSAQKTMQNLSKREKQIEEDPKLSESQRKEKLRELELRRIEICERVFNKAR